MAYKYPVTIGGLNITADIESGSYKTSAIPVKTTVITTMDGVDHCALIRTKGCVSFNINPATAARAAAIAAKLRDVPCVVTYTDLQTNASRTANMVVDSITAEHISGINYNSSNWSKLATVTLTEM